MIRDARVDDVPGLVRLGWSIKEEWPSGQIIVGEIGGLVAAALVIDESRAVAADVSDAPDLPANMRARAAGILAHGCTPSVSERTRERMHAAVAVDARLPNASTQPPPSPRQARGRF